MATRMQQRRGTAAQWTSADPILAAGEIGFETDTGKFKIGDGTSGWSSLSYFTDSQDFDTTNFVLNNTLGTPNGVATLNGDGNIPISQLGALIANAPETLDTLEELATYVTNLDSMIDSHNQDTTNIHGIADTSLLETQTGAQNKADAAQAAAIAAAGAAAEAYTTSEVNGAQAAAIAAAEADATTKSNNVLSLAENALTSHNAATTDVHGIPDTSELETQTGAQNKADAAQAAAIAAAEADATTKANAAQTAAETTAASALSAHNSDTTNVHGISDTANIVLTDDARLSDERTPLDASVTDAKINGTLSQSSITNLTTDLAAKATIESPALTGTPTAPTATAGDNSTQVATTAYVETAVSSLVASAPGTLDTLNELAAALGDDANFSTTVTNSLALKLEQSDLDNATYYAFNGQTASYTIALSDSTNMVTINSGSGTTVTVPANSSVAFPIGTYIDIFQLGTGQVTVAEGSGVTIYATPGKKLRTQYSGASLVKRDTDTWYLTGDIVA